MKRNNDAKLDLPIDNVFYSVNKGKSELYIANGDFTRVRSYKEFIERKGDHTITRERTGEYSFNLKNKHIMLQKIKPIIESECDSCELCKTTFDSFEELEKFYKFMQKTFNSKKDIIKIF